MTARIQRIGPAVRDWRSAPSGIADALISLEEITRIADFCGPALQSLPEGERDKILADAGKELLRQGHPLETVLQIWKQFQKRRRGHPSELVAIAYKGLCMKEENKSLTWKTFTEQHCPCKKSRHDEACRKSIERVARKIKLELRRFGIIPT
jgi:hypothetical protein